MQMNVTLVMMLMMLMMIMMMITKNLKKSDELQIKNEPEERSREHGPTKPRNFR